MNTPTATLLRTEEALHHKLSDSVSPTIKETGPWDSSAINSTRQENYSGKHRLHDSVRLSLTSCDFDISTDYLDSVLLDTPVNGEYSDSIHMIREQRISNDTACQSAVSLKILASPSNVSSRWEDHLVEMFVRDVASWFGYPNSRIIRNRD